MALVPLVVKVGGEAIADAEVRAVVAGEIAALQQRGLSVVVVHGGGIQATELAARLGVERRVLAGRRFTDDATLEIMKMAVAGVAGTDLVAALHAAGARALASSGVGGVIRAARRPPRVVAGGGDEPVDFGHVGDVVDVDTARLGFLAGAGLIPVLACLASDEDGRVYNINADIVATRVATALMSPLVLLIGPAGVLADPDDPATRLPRLTPSEFRARVADGTIRGGMLPKLEESFRALADGGTPSIHLLPAATPGGIRQSLDEPGSVGTVLQPE